ncbi:unnamed protein product [Paramecium sonneborni]|uniref:3-oxo-5-alpha-steroid 4-dehydrogenase C-terminal domain-containing protein n=1 Tax=Paramecium sonneborni TaxID=65129 RepID=A0A8S1QLV9_9CILI|nr:unnamed protein product [Paramecium sonneborni]
MFDFQFISIIIILGFSFAAWTADLLKIGYGKHLSHYMKLTLPSKLGWILYECPNLIWFIYFLSDIKFDLNSLPIILFVTHYFNRVIIYPLRLSPFARPIPIEVVTSAILFTTCNGYLQISTHLNQDHQFQIFDYLRILLGLLVFLYGMTSNIKCDNILRNLKKINSNEYKIPFGNLFELVSSGHYLGEIIEWFGYFLVSGQWSGFLFFFSTLSILSARAISTHKWYKNKFHNYPKQRKAIIPYIL